METNLTTQSIALAPHAADVATAPTAHRPRALVLEPQALMREALRVLLESEARCEVTGLAGTLDEAIALARRAAPDLIVVGLDRATCAGASPVASLLDAAPEARILVVTSSSDLEPRVAAVRAGAHGAVGLERSTRDLADAVTRVLGGGYALDPAIVPRLFDRLPSPVDPLTGLTRRERQVASHVCEGMRNKQVGARLGISEITVRHHLTAVYEKLGVKDRLELVLKVTKKA